MTTKTRSVWAVLMGIALLGVLALTTTFAWADEGRLAVTLDNQDAKAVQQATTYKSSYALYKNDGYVYRCDKNGKVLSNGKKWSASPDSYADVLFIDKAVTSIPERGIVKYVLASNGKSIEVYLKNIGKNKVVFLLDSKGKNACKTIGNKAFSNAKTKQYVNFNKTSVTKIGDEAFSYNSNLTSITLPSTLTSMGTWAFAGCEKLTGITIPGSLKTVPSAAFYNCTALANLTITSGVKKIDNSAFAHCKALKKVDLPATVKELGNSSFYNCASLKTVYLRSTTKIKMPVQSFSGTPLDTSTGAKNGAWFYAPNNLLSSYRANVVGNSWRTYKTHFKALPASSSKKKTTAKKPTTTAKTTPIYWLVHKTTGENLYTQSSNEAQTLKNRGKWTLKGIKWYAPKTGQKVYRLVNLKTGDHHYTKSANEVRVLTKVRKTWRSDFSGNAVFYSGGNVKLIRLYSDARYRAGKAGTHRFEHKQAEVKKLVKQGWRDEGALLMAAKAGNV